MKRGIVAVAVGAAIIAVANAQSGPTLTDYFVMMPTRVLDPTYLGSPPWLGSPFTADLDGDGNDDLIVLGADLALNGAPVNVPQPGRVFFGDGSGGFSPARQFPVATLKMVQPRKVLFADFNGDGTLDMFIACHGWDTQPYPGEQNRLYLSQPGGGWTDATATLPQLSDYSHTAAVGDVSGRGVNDIIVGNYFGAQNKILSYALLNNGGGQFTMTQSILPVGPGQTMDANSGHYLLGTTLTDLNGDGLPELIVTGDASDATKKLTHTTILWNHSGTFADTDKTELPSPFPFRTHIDLDAQSIDLNGDGLQDIVLVGSQGNPFYDGWFVQLLLNVGNKQFVDVTSSHLAATDVFGGTPDVATKSPWAMWVKVLDYNGDGAPDFALEFAPYGDLPSNQPLIYLNDGAGYFSTLKVRDFVAPGNESLLGGGHLMRTRNGYSFITTQLPPYEPRPGLIATGLLATKPYRVRTSSLGPPRRLDGGSSISSSNGRYRLTLQANGNLVIVDSVANKPVWATNTSFTPGNLTMQLDGNLVLYDGTGGPRWSSNTGGNPGAYFQLQDDGNLVVYSAAATPIWGAYGH